jgi:hypothetical protein
LRPALTLPGTAARTILAAAILALLWPALPMHRDTGSPGATRPAPAVAEAGNRPADTWT